MMAPRELFFSWLATVKYNEQPLPVPNPKIEHHTPLARFPLHVTISVAEALSRCITHVCTSCQVALRVADCVCPQCFRRPLSLPQPLPHSQPGRTASSNRFATSAADALFTADRVSNVVPSSAARYVYPTLTVRSLLAECQLLVALPHFEANDVRDSDLLLLNEADIAALLPAVAARRRFITALQARRAQITEMSAQVRTRSQ
jgi:hypothetical protein